MNIIWWGIIIYIISIWTVLGTMYFRNKCDTIKWPNTRLKACLLVLKCGPIIWVMAMISGIEMITKS